MGFSKIIKGVVDKELLDGFRRIESLSVKRKDVILSGLKKIEARYDAGCVDRSKQIPSSIIDELFGLGIFSLLVPEKYNGLGFTCYEFCEIIASLAEIDLSLAVTVVPHSGMGVESIVYYGTEEQKNELLGLLSARRCIVSFALTESQAGSEVENHRTSIIMSNDGMVIDGIKNLITNASVSQIIIAVAKCPGLSGIPGGSAFVIVDKNRKGITVSDPYEKTGIRGSVTSEILFNNVRITRDDILGEPGKAMEQFNRIVSSGRIGVAAGSLGSLRKILQCYKNGSESHVPEESRTDYDAFLFIVESSVILASICHDLGFPDTIVSTGLVKIFSTNNAWILSNEIIKKAGLRLYINDCTFNLVYRDIPILRITEGPNEVLDYRCGLELAFSLMKKQTGERDITPYLHESLRETGLEFNSLLATYGDFMETVFNKRERFLENQLLLHRVSEATTWVFCLLACLLYSTTSIALSKVPEKTLVSWCEYCFSLCRKSLRRAVIEEDGTTDEIIDEVSGIQKQRSYSDLMIE
jgi:alkylation response protein AidB-like acyl-CoA dehydrogenase